MNNIFIFESTIYKLGTDEVVETIHCLAYNALQATHIVDHWVEEHAGYLFPVEFGGIHRLRGINHIINPEFWAEEFLDEDGDDNQYTGDIPIQVAKNMMETEVMEFDCPSPKCSERIKVPKQMMFPFVTCPKCGLEIKRNNIHEAGNIFYATLSDDEDKLDS